MEKIDHAISEIREMDELAAMSSPVHKLHPTAKLVATAVYILFVVSFGKYDLGSLFVLVLYPILMFACSGISVRTCFRKMKIGLLLVLAVGIWNPLLDREPMLYLGGIAVSGGVISMLTLMLKGTLCLMASFLLAATTGMDSVCAALRDLHFPGMIVTLLLLTYRYISVMMEEVSVMTTAYKLRAPGQKGIRFSAWGSFLGQLFLRSVDRAQEIYDSMQQRGFDGEFRYVRREQAKTTDYIFVIVSVCLFAACRFFPVTDWIGRIASGGSV